MRDDARFFVFYYIMRKSRDKMKKMNSSMTVSGEMAAKKLETKTLALSAIMIAIGFVLHSVTPPLFFGIKPDFLLACLFVAVIAGGNYKNALTAGVVAGIVAALTTGFPGGQIPSIFDKIISATAVYFMVRMIPESLGASAKVLVFAIISFVGTVVSGLVFLGTALMLAGLPAPFGALVVGIVLPTAAANMVMGALIYKLQVKFLNF